MPASVFVSSEDPLFDPDQLKMPESPLHREAIETIAFAAMALLGSAVEIYRDMNLYPVDGGNAVAPDVMVLPAGTLAASLVDKPKSYRQDQTDGPVPSVVVEVPSDTDSWSATRVKIDRYRRLGVPVYIVTVDGMVGVDPYDPEAIEAVPWVGRAIPDLGGLHIEFDHADADRTIVVMPTGVRGSSHAEALARQLRDLGVDPQV